jgi:hypothetical protein
MKIVLQIGASTAYKGSYNPSVDRCVSLYHKAFKSIGINKKIHDEDNCIYRVSISASGHCYLTEQEAEKLLLEDENVLNKVIMMNTKSTKIDFVALYATIAGRQLDLYLKRNSKW